MREGAESAAVSAASSCTLCWCLFSLATIGMFVTPELCTVFQMVATKCSGICGTQGCDFFQPDQSRARDRLYCHHHHHKYRHHHRRHHYRLAKTSVVRSRRGLMINVKLIIINQDPVRELISPTTSVPLLKSQQGQ